MYYLLLGGDLQEDDDPNELYEGDDLRYIMTVDGYQVARDPKTNLHVLSWDLDGVADQWAVVESEQSLGKVLTDAQFRYRCRIARGIHTDG